MWNKFKLWFNRNDLRMLIIALIVFGIYLFVKGANEVFKNEIKQSIANNANNTSVFENTIYTEDDLTKVESKDDYKDVQSAYEKILKTLYNAGKNSDVSIRQDLLNMCSNQFIKDFTTPKRAVTTDNVYDYMFGVKTLSEYGIVDIFLYGSMNNIDKYVLHLKDEIDSEHIEYFYIVINLDRNNGTFSYDGSFMDVEYIYKGDPKYETIENKGVNVY